MSVRPRYPALLFPVLGVIAVSLTFFIISCGNGSSEKATEDSTEEAIADSDTVQSGNFLSELSKLEMDYIRNLREQGGLKIAVSNAPESYRVDENGERGGFDYVYAQSFAAALELELEVTVVTQISRFFAEEDSFDDSVISDPSISYIPGLMDEVDIYAGPFAINDWRQKLVAMVPFFPVGVVIMGLEAEDITSYEDLDGLSVAVQPGDFQIPMLLSIMETYDVEMTFVKYTDESRVFEILRKKEADITIDGSLFLAEAVQELDYMTVSPLTLSLVPVGWAVDPREEQLAGILQKYASFTLDSGKFAAIWNQESEVDFDYYLDMVSVQERE